MHVTIGKAPYDHVKPLEQSSIATKDYLLRTSRKEHLGSGVVYHTDFTQPE